MPKSPASLRILQSVATIVGASDSLESINTQLVMDRGLVTVIENDQIYMLRRSSTATPSGSDIVAPAQGGPGRWFSYPSGGAGGLAALGAVTMGVLEGVTYPTSTENTLQPASIVGSLEYAGSASMSLDVDKLVFSEPGTYLVQCMIVLNVGASASSKARAAAIGFNGDLIGDDYPDAVPFGGQVLSVVLAGSPATQVEQWLFNLVRRVTVTTPGDYVQALVQAVSVSDADEVLWGFTLSALQVSP